MSEARSPSQRPLGRRVADRPVDSSVMALDKPYVGRRKAVVPGPQPAKPAPDRITLPGEALLDTAAVDLVLAALEPVDQTTSFAHEHTAEIPLPRAARRAEPVPSTPGKRRAVKHAGSRGPLFKGLPSAPVLVGIAALAVSIGGVLTSTEPGMASNDGGRVAPASALTGASGVGIAGGDRDRIDRTSRDSSRDAQSDAAGEDLQEEVEGQAAQHFAEIRELANQAEGYSKLLAKDLWRYPVSSVSLTAYFGQYGLWSSYHTGLDFNGNTGDPVYSVANGVVTSAGYDGAYGNKVVVQLEDGTEIWYCHLNSFAVSVGEVVRGGEGIGTVGATGHVTGSHLHLEVRPGGGDPVDPHLAMQQHGLF